MLRFPRWHLIGTASIAHDYAAPVMLKKRTPFRALIYNVFCVRI